jgi:hypothetical protein
VTANKTRNQDRRDIPESETKVDLLILIHLGTDVGQERVDRVGNVVWSCVTANWISCDAVDACSLVLTKQSSCLSMLELIGNLVLALLYVEFVLALESNLADSPDQQWGTSGQLD